MSFACGKATNFCYELQNLVAPSYGLPKFMHMYNRSWSAKVGRLDGARDKDTHALFDIIDTSNLCDSIGLLSLLPAAAPLLKRDPQSILHTDSLLLAAENPSETLAKLLRADIASVCLISGFVPVRHLLGTTTDNYGCDLILQQIDMSEARRQTQFRA